MRGATKRKVATSGRLTGADRGQASRRRSGLAAAGRPEAAYSLHSTDSDDQVTSLHAGLDRCAAVLGGILQAGAAASSPGPRRALRGGAARPRPPPPASSSSLGKKSSKRAEQRSSPLAPRGPAHPGVRLHPPKPPTRLQGRTPPPHTPGAPPPLAGRREGGVSDDDDLVPVKEEKPGGVAMETHTDSGCSDRESRLETIHFLLGELRTLIAGQGSVAERLLTHLEHTVTSPLMNGSASNAQAESSADVQSLHIQNTQLRRRVRTLNQQLKEKERQQNPEPLGGSQVWALQEELGSAQVRLQELQVDLTELRAALQDTQTQLREREAQNTLIRTDLESVRVKLQLSEQEKVDLASLAQRRLQEIQDLNRVFQSRDSSDFRRLVDVSALDAPTERVSQYLRSLEQLRPEAAEGAAADPTRPLDAPRPDGTRPPVEQQAAAAAAASDTIFRLQPPEEGRAVADGRRRLFESVLSQCDATSVTSDWTVTSGSTFDTRDEAAFRDGLAALDASIASLQQTIKLDLGR